MSDLSKIVHDRLRSSVPGEVHPDADLLTAFAEQALSGAEREGVLQHLARCGVCREVVVLSIPASVEAAERPASVAAETSVRRPADRQAWFAWPRLRWAALAASVVVVGSVLLLRPGTQTDLTIKNEKTAVQVGEPVPAIGPKAGAPATSALQPTQSYSMTTANKTNGALASEQRARVRDKQTLGGLNIRAATPPVPFTDSKRMDSLAGQSGSLNGTVPVPASSTPAASVADRGAGSANETVEVISSQAQVNTESATLGELTTSQQVLEPGGSRGAAQSESLPLNGRNFTQLSIVKAKPAAADLATDVAAKEKADVAAKEKKEELQTEAALQPGATVNKAPSSYSDTAALGLQKQQLTRNKDVVAQWSLAQGKLQRSVDAGATWQIALQLEHPLLTFGARGNNIWAGGQTGTLFHSTDSGSTWAMVQPSTNAGALTADIVAIEIRGPAEVVLSTSNNESWATTDSGRSWEKK